MSWVTPSEIFIGFWVAILLALVVLIHLIKNNSMRVRISEIDHEWKKFIESMKETK